LHMSRISRVFLLSRVVRAMSVHHSRHVHRSLLISELNSSNSTAATQAFRSQGSIPDSERAVLRKLAKWVLGIPIAFAATAGLFALIMMRASDESITTEADEGMEQRDER
jgi:hypothetical protein